MHDLVAGKEYRSTQGRSSFSDAPNDCKTYLLRRRFGHMKISGPQVHRLEIIWRSSYTVPL
jgi:hypothetical protein